MTSYDDVSVDIMTHAQLRDIDWGGTIAVTVHDPADTAFPMYDVGAPVTVEVMGRVLPLVFDCIFDGFALTDKDVRIMSRWIKNQLDDGRPPKRIVFADRVAGERACALALATDAVLNGPRHAAAKFLQCDDNLPDDMVFSTAYRHLKRYFCTPEDRFDWASEFAANHARWHEAHPNVGL